MRWGKAVPSTAAKGTKEDFDGEEVEQEGNGGGEGAAKNGVCDEEGGEEGNEEQ